MQAVRYILLLGSILFTVTLWSQIPVNTNFNPAIAAPMDVRSKINTLSDTATILFKYDGMITYVVSNQKTYVRKPGVWEEIGAGAGGVAGVASINGETGIVSLKTVNSVPISGSGNIEVDTMIGRYDFIKGRVSNLIAPLNKKAVKQIYWGGTSVTSIDPNSTFFQMLKNTFGDSGNFEFLWGQLGGSFSIPYPSNSQTPLATDWRKRRTTSRQFIQLVGNVGAVEIKIEGIGKRFVLTYTTEVGGGSFDATVNGVTRTINCGGAQSMGNAEVWDFDSIVPLTVTIGNVQSGQVYLEHGRFEQNLPGGIDVLYGAMGGSSLQSKLVNQSGGVGIPAWEIIPVADAGFVGFNAEFDKKTEYYDPQILFVCWVLNDLGQGIQGLENYYIPVLQKIVDNCRKYNRQLVLIPEMGGYNNIEAHIPGRPAILERVRQEMYRHARENDFVTIIDWGGTIEKGYDFSNNADILKYQQKYYFANYDTLTHTYTGDFTHPHYAGYAVLSEMLKDRFRLNLTEDWNIVYAETKKPHSAKDAYVLGSSNSLLFNRQKYEKEIEKSNSCQLFPIINNYIDACGSPCQMQNNTFYLVNSFVNPFDTITMLIAVDSSVSIGVRNYINTSYLPLIEKSQIIQPVSTLTTPFYQAGIRHFYVTFIADETGRAFMTASGKIYGAWFTKGFTPKITDNNECWSSYNFPSNLNQPIVNKYDDVAKNEIDPTIKNVYLSPFLESNVAETFNFTGSYRSYNKCSFINNGVIQNMSPNRLRIGVVNNILQPNEKYSIFFKAAVVDTLTGRFNDNFNYRIYVYNGFTNTTYYYTPSTSSWSTTPASDNYLKTNKEGVTYLTFNMLSNYLPLNSFELYIEFQSNPFLTLLSPAYISKGDSLYIPNPLADTYPYIDVDATNNYSRIYRIKKPLGSATVAAPMFQFDMTTQAGTAYLTPNKVLNILLQSDRGYRTGLIEYQFSRSNFEDLMDGVFYLIKPNVIKRFPGATSVGQGAHGLYVKRSGNTFRFWVLAQEDNMFATVYSDDIALTIINNIESSYTITGVETPLESVYANFNRFTVYEKDGTAPSYVGGVVLDYSTTSGGFIFVDGATTREIVDVPTGALTNDHVVVVSGTTFSTRADKEGVTSVTVNAGAGISVTGSPITSSGILTVTNTGDADASDDITGESIPVTHDFPSIAVGGIQSATVTVAGANAGKVLVVNADLPDGVLLQIKSTSPDTARLTIFNFTGALYDPSLTTFEIRVLN